MSGVKNGIGLCRSHFEVEEDALLICRGQEKMDHGGRKARDARHVFANPNQLEISQIFRIDG